MTNHDLKMLNRIIAAVEGLPPIGLSSDPRETAANERFQTAVDKLREYARQFSYADMKTMREMRYKR